MYKPGQLVRIDGELYRITKVSSIKCSECDLKQGETYADMKHCIRYCARVHMFSSRYVLKCISNVQTRANNNSQR